MKSWQSQASENYTFVTFTPLKSGLKLLPLCPIKRHQRHQISAKIKPALGQAIRQRPNSMEAVWVLTIQCQRVRWRMANGEWRGCLFFKFFQYHNSGPKPAKSASIDGSGTCGRTAAHAGADTGGIEPEVTCAMLSESFTDSTPGSRLSEIDAL